MVHARPHSYFIESLHFLGAKAPLGLAMGVTVSVSVSHEKVSRLQDVARTSYIRYLPTIICKDLLVLLSPPCLCWGMSQILLYLKGNLFC